MKIVHRYRVYEFQELMKSDQLITCALHGLVTKVIFLQFLKFVHNFCLHGRYAIIFDDEST